MAPKINNASKFIKNIKSIKKGNSDNPINLTDKNKLRLDLSKLRKEDLIIERDTLKKKTIKKIKEITENEKSISKQLKELNIIFGSSRMTKKEKNEIIKETLKNLMQKRKENKDLISYVEIEEELIKSTSIILKIKSIEALDAYHNLVMYIEKMAKAQFGNTGRAYIFQSHALKEITQQLQKSDNIPLTFRKIFSKLNKT